MDKVKIFLTALTGEAAIAATAQFPTMDELQQAVQIVVQIIIGVVALLKIFKEDEKKEDKKTDN